MANPAAAVDRHMPAGLLRHAIELANRRRAAARRHRVRPQLIANFAVFLVFAAGSIVIYHGAANPSGIIDDPAYAPLAFLLYLLGIWLVLLALVAERFPGAATVGEAMARALCGFFFGARR